jgi:hypothetical protein
MRDLLRKLCRRWWASARSPLLEEQISEKISRRILSGDQGMIVWWSIGVHAGAGRFEGKPACRDGNHARVRLADDAFFAMALEFLCHPAKGDGDAQVNLPARRSAQWTYKKSGPADCLGAANGSARQELKRGPACERPSARKHAISAVAQSIAEALSPRTPRCRSTEADCIAVEQPTGAGPTTRPPCQSRRPSRRAPRRLPPSTLPHPCAVARSTRSL